MATNGDSDGEQSDACRVVTDVAVSKAVDRCGSEGAVKDVIADMFGWGDDEDYPDCDAVLDGGITEDVLESPQGERRYAMCRAWQLVNDEGMQFRSAINQAWTEIREAEEEAEE